MNTIPDRLAELHRSESRRLLATIVRLVRDFDLAEEVLQEAFTTALEKWEVDGVPENPRAWLVSTARFKAIDTLRRRGRFEELHPELAQRHEEVQAANQSRLDAEIEDDQLRCIFACCHPSLDPSLQVPLTLREICGLTTEEIASAFLIAPATMAQRIVRGKAKIREARIPFAIPSASDLPERLDSVLTVIYLVFTEGYSATTGDQVTRAELSEEAIRLGRLLVELLPDPEAIGLLALMLLQESRRTARMTATGDIILLEEQNRSLWNSDHIQEGLDLVQQSLATRRFGAYTLQAAIAGVHARARTPALTDWGLIVSLYTALHTLQPSPVIELNRAVAVAMRDGPAAGIHAIDTILSGGNLQDYHLAHAARADLYRRLGKVPEARSAYQRALELVKQGPERRFLLRRLDELAGS